MAVSVARDLSVTVTDHTAEKLMDRQQALRESIQKGEPKVMGVSEVMVGVTVISYSIPLLATDFTEVMTFGVPWWSGLVFILAGAVAIATEKFANMKFLCACLAATSLAVLVSVLALIFYFIDLGNNPATECNQQDHYDQCEEQHYATTFSRGVKSSLLLFTIVQTVISCILSVSLYRERRNFTQYMSLNQNLPPSPAVATPSELD
ncbi:hypothetical protein MATL_G00221050 [Megalops atlanticus]|uniref:Membrane-spanning 4-domains subfamily A member 12 n=1 Tax=Megalops atlanticus TaxID=7932 RepID=A0A9D3PJ36_MEGAT|nr:hypothetical protein MATL_G00221050 [Megalops atlanticus]